MATGYSFNQDESAIYQTIATLFIAQAMNINLTWTELVAFLLVLMVTSTAAAGVSGSAFVALDVGQMSRALERGTSPLAEGSRPASEQR